MRIKAPSFTTFTVFFATLWIAIFAMGYINHNTNRCATFAVDQSYEEFFAVGKFANQMIDVSFDRDSNGDAVQTATATLEFCSLELSTACGDFDFDTDGNGLGDTNILTDSATQIETSGVRGISGFNYLRVTQSGTVGAAVPLLTVCRRAS